MTDCREHWLRGQEQKLSFFFGGNEINEREFVSREDSRCITVSPVSALHHTGKNSGYCARNMEFSISCQIEIACYYFSQSKSLLLDWSPAQKPIN